MEVGDAYFEIFVETRIVEMKIKTKDALEEQIKSIVMCLSQFGIRAILAQDVSFL